MIPCTYLRGSRFDTMSFFEGDGYWSSSPQVGIGDVCRVFVVATIMVRFSEIYRRCISKRSIPKFSGRLPDLVIFIIVYNFVAWPRGIRLLSQFWWIPADQVEQDDGWKPRWKQQSSSSLHLKGGFKFTGLLEVVPLLQHYYECPVTIVEDMKLIIIVRGIIMFSLNITFDHSQFPKQVLGHKSSNIFCS